MKRRRALRVALIAAAIVALGLILRRFAFGTVRVAGTSMQQTLCGGDVALVTRFDYAGGRTPQRGDVVECRFPGRSDTYIKRVVGLPGEAIAFRGGTDGSALSQRGLPCPNLSAGYENAHGRFEYVPIPSMEKNVEILLRLAARFAADDA